MDLLLAELRIVIEANLCITHDHTTIGEFCEGVDFHHGAVALCENLVQGLNALGCRCCLGTFEAHLLSHLGCLCSGQTLDDVDWNLHDGGGIGSSDVLNGSTSGLTSNHDRPAAATIHENCEILLVLDLKALRQHYSAARL